MVAKARTIEVPSDSEVARFLSGAEAGPLVVVAGGKRFRVEREESPTGEPADPWADYDPDRARAGLRAAAGAWQDIDTDQLVDDIYRWRKEGSRSPDRR